MTSRIEQIEELINRLACDAVVGTADSAAVRARIEELAARVEALEAEGAAGVATAIRSRIGKVEAGPGEAISAIQAEFANWRSGRVGGGTSPPLSSIDDEVAALAADPELASMFLAESLDHLGTIEASVLALEKNPADGKILNEVFRPFHTIKGNASVLGLTRVQGLAHILETLLDLGRSGKHRMGAPEIEVILRSVDHLTTMIADLGQRLQGSPGADQEPARKTLISEVERLIKAAAASTHDAGSDAPVVADAGDVSASRTEDTSPEVTAMEVFSQKREDVAAVGSVKVDTRKLDNLIDMVGELVIAQSIIYHDPTLLRVADERLNRQLAQLRRITSELQRDAMAMRMVPIRQTFQKMSRLVRDLCKKSGKNVELELSGEDTELDRKVVEEINDPLMHMIRNAVDHGIEDSASRHAAGKPAKGTISLTAYHQGGNIVIALSDDGGGLNTEKIRAKAIANGLLRPEDALSPNEIYHLIFQPGFSTADRVTEISGRGVGMDVVRRNIEALRGRIEIQTTPGKGTTFLIKLPLTLAIIEGLLLQVGSEAFVIPTFAVRESLRPLPEQVHRVQGEPRLVQVRGSLLPLLRLSDHFGIAGRYENPSEATVVVVEDDGRFVALMVDELIGKQEVVIKSLGPTFAGVRGISGGAILAEGRIGLILDPNAIVASVCDTSARAA